MRNLRRVMLAMPNSKWFNARSWVMPPYTLGLLAAVVPDEYELCVVDASLEDLTPDEVAARVREFAPDVLGVSCMSLEYAKSAHRFIEVAKQARPETVIVMGGVYGTTSPEIALEDSNIDYLVLGEGEHRLPHLLEALNSPSPDFSLLDGIAYRGANGPVVVPVRSFVTDLDTLPLPAYHKLDFQAYLSRSNRFANVLLPRYFPYTVTTTSRGCPFHCIYCSTHAIDGRKIRMKSAGRVLEEMDWLVREHGIKEVIFLDDNLAVDRARFKAILEGLIERDYDLHWKSVNLATFLLDDELLELMKASKTYQIILPIESGNQEILGKILKKPLDLSKVPPLIEKAKALGFEIAADFIIGIPGESWDQIRETIRFAEEMDVDMVSFHIATPLPRTELYELAQQERCLDPEFNFTTYPLFGFGRGCITTEEFRPQDLHMLRALEWDRINFRTDEKRERFARMAGMSREDLASLRRNTIRNLGIYFPKEA